MPLSCYSVLRVPSSFYTNLRSPLLLPSALDYFGLDVQAKDVIIADDDAGGVGKRIRSSACINALACAERAAEYIKTLLVQPFACRACLGDTNRGLNRPVAWHAREEHLPT